MVFIYADGVISAAVIIGTLAYLYRENAAIDKKREQEAASASAGADVAAPEMVAEQDSAEQGSVDTGDDEVKEQTDSDS